MERGFEYRPKTSFAGHEGSRPTERRPMQRSMSLSNGLQRRDSQRVVIRPDPSFTKVINRVFNVTYFVEKVEKKCYVLIILAVYIKDASFVLNEY